MANKFSSLRKYYELAKDHINEVYDTLNSGSTGKNIRHDAASIKKALLNTYPMLSKDPQYVTADDMLSSGFGAMPLSVNKFARLPETEFSRAHAIAQKNAALPVEQGGLGLHPDNTAMERARALGFDIPAYRGQSTEIPESLAIKEYPWRNDYKEIFSTDSPEIASSYALRDGVSGDGYVMPLMLRNDNGAVLDWKGDKFTSDRNLFREYSEKKDKGHDFVAVKNIRDNFDSSVNTEPHTNFISLDPKNIRSRFAAFDPLKKNSANILASGLLGSAILNDKKKSRKKSD